MQYLIYLFIQQASKEAVLAQLSQAECVHFATHVCWKTPAIILSPGEVVSKSDSVIDFDTDIGGTYTQKDLFIINLIQVDSQAKRLLNTSVGSGAADTSTENEEESMLLSLL